MKSLLTYLFWPNPGNASYSSPKAFALLIVCCLLLGAAALLSVWRRRQANPRLKQISRLWPAVSFWAGLTGMLLIVARVEQIQFLAMRVWWVIWMASIVFFCVQQVRLFRARYYKELPMKRVRDPRGTYLPKRKKR